MFARLYACVCIVDRSSFLVDVTTGGHLTRTECADAMLWFDSEKMCVTSQPRATLFILLAYLHSENDDKSGTIEAQKRSCLKRVTKTPFEI